MEGVEPLGLVCGVKGASMISDVRFFGELESVITREGGMRRFLEEEMVGGEVGGARANNSKSSAPSIEKFIRQKLYILI